jgi:predicted ATPase/GAF domain-containing protein
MLVDPKYGFEEKISFCPQFVFYGGRCTRDGSRVLLKTPIDEIASPRIHAWLNHELDISTRIPVHGILRPLESVTTELGPALALEYFGGRPVTLRLGEALDIPTALSICAHSARVLSLIHECGFLHGALCPTAIWANESATEVRIGEFGQACRLTNGERGAHGHWPVFPDRWPFMSPEQTGRTRYPLDGRSDLYSLGMVLYRMVTGRMPWEAADAPGWIHAHLAQEPAPPQLHDPSIPGPISDLIMCLLSKHPAQRIHSATQLADELEESKYRFVERSWERYVGVDAWTPNYELIGRDRIWGRSVELSRLEKGFLLARAGSKEITIVEGDSGLGKSTLIKDFLSRISTTEALSFCGKCQLFQETVPFSGIVEALKDLINRLMLSGPQHAMEWKTYISASMGILGQPLVSLLPELAWISGVSDEVAATEPVEARNRLELSLYALFDCLALRAGCLVLFFDDVQWMDGDSLRFLQSSVSKLRGNILLLAAIRAGEIMNTESNEALSAEFLKAGWNVSEFRLEPLDCQTVAMFLADVFSDTPDSMLLLAKTLHDKTGGNPLFIKELLRFCLDSGFIRSKSHMAGWRIDLEPIRAMKVTDTVAEFLAGRVNSIFHGEREALSAAACIGNSFESQRLRFLLQSMEKEEENQDPESWLDSALRSGMLITTQKNQPSATGYGSSPRIFSFSHDRIRQACYDASPSKKLAEWHGKLCDLYLSEHEINGDMQVFFEAVGQANLSQAHDASSPRRGLAELNRDAGRLSLENGSFSTAQIFFKFGLAHLSEEMRDQWADAYLLSLELHLGLAESALKNGDYREMECALSEIEFHARERTDKAALYEIRIFYLIAQNRKIEAVLLAQSCLSQLGVKLPKRPGKIHGIFGLVGSIIALRRRPIEALSEGPVMDDPEALAAIRILRSIYSVSYLSMPEMFPLLVFKTITLSLRYGNSSFSSTTFAAYGIILAGLMGKYEEALRFGQLSLNLQKTSGISTSEAKIVMAVYAFIMPWKKPLKELLPFLRDGFNSGIALGDLEFAGYCNNIYAQIGLHSGRGLAGLHRDIQEFQEFNRRAGHLRALAMLELYSEYNSALTNGDGVKTLPPEPQFCLQQMSLGSANEEKNMSYLYFLLKCIHCHLFEDYGKALEFAGEARMRSAAHFGYFVTAVLTFHESLLLLGNKTLLRFGDRARIRSNAKKMKKWALHAPENFRHKFELMQAEYYRRTGRLEKAIAHFESAVACAQASDYTNEEALALELYARFHIARGRVRLGLSLLRDAHQAYLRWGANAKAKQLEIRFSYLFLVPAQSKEKISVSVSPASSESLDVISILKASQAISSERNLSRLSEQVLRVVVEYAAVRYGCLILERKDGTRWIESQHGPQKGSSPEGSLHLERQSHFPATVINYVAETGKTLAFDAGIDPLFLKDPCFRTRKPKSMLCMPLVHQGKSQGVLYLENDLTESAYSTERQWILSLIANQAAISIANSNYHALKLESQQAKINPHFLFNALSSIANLASSDPTMTETAIVKLSNLYRYILTSSEEKTVTLKQELEIVKTYLMLEKLRFGAKLSFSIDAEEDGESIELPGMLIQPIVENSIRHGISPKLDPGMVIVTTRLESGQCHISVEDDGDMSGMGKPGTGFGLRSVRERLELAYPGNHSIEIRKSPGFRVDIWIPAGPSA